MIILTNANGEEQLIADRELTGLHTELRDLLQRQIAAARREQREKDAAIVRDILEQWTGSARISLDGVAFAKEIIERINL